MSHNPYVPVDVERFSMSLTRFAVTCSFRAWSPGDRYHPERKVFISPGPNDVFTDQHDPAGNFIKFLKCGAWYEAERDEFARNTKPLGAGIAISARHGG
jgi:hypothetical protein